MVRPFVEDFGSAAQPNFAAPQALAVDQDGGDLLVVDATAQTLSRFKSNGEPSPFSALGTNVIDAIGDGAGPGSGGSCSPPSLNCDETPENGFFFGMSATQVQIAVDNSGNANTDGNIYVTQASKAVVDIFSSDGEYVGQIKQFRNVVDEQQQFARPSVEFIITIPGFGTTIPMAGGGVGGTSNPTLCENINSVLENVAGPGMHCSVSGIATKTVTFIGGLAGTDAPTMQIKRASDNSLIQEAITTKPGGPTPTALGAVCGATVAPDGSLFLGDPNPAGGALIHKYVPSANPPLAIDNVANFPVGGGAEECNLAAGAAAPSSGTEGFLFGRKSGGGFQKRNADTGAGLYAFGSGSGTTVAVNPADGRVLAIVGGTATEYDASGTLLAELKVESTLEAGSAIQGVAVHGATNRVYVARSGSSEVEVFGSPIATPTVTRFPVSDTTATTASLHGSVDPEGTEITECKFEYGQTLSYGASIPCAEAIPTDSDPHPVSAILAGLKSEQLYHYRLVAKNLAGESETNDGTFTTGSLVITGPATSVSDVAATLNGSVTPAGSQFSTCRFEYMTEADFFANGNGYSGLKTPQVKDCTPPAASIEPDFSPHPVSAALVGLAKNTTYHFRLVATKGPTTYAGPDRSFTTQGPPSVFETVPLLVDKTSATLQAKINPNGTGTTYFFEWGVDASYGNSAPVDVEPFLGSGTSLATATAKVDSLQEAHTYHFRVVASNASGTTKGPDRTFQTLNGCGFIENRCLELVSPADKGPLGEAGEVVLLNGGSARFRPASAGSKVAYILGYGLPNSDSGGEVIYQSNRTDDAWGSEQISPPALESANLAINMAGRIVYLSGNLDCAYFLSQQALTADTPRPTIEAGEENLYLRKPDGSFQLLTPRAATSYPLAPTALEMSVIGASADCERVVFVSELDYLGVGSGIQDRLYEWDHGTLRNVGIVPGGPTQGVPAQPGAAMSNYWNAVASDLSRVAFTATRQSGGLPAEHGKSAVFMRKNATETLDVSKSETSEPSNGAFYQTASQPTGKRVFFLSNYGLAGPSSTPGVTSCSGGDGDSGAGCDLYLYDEDKPSGNRLTDLSATTAPANTGGAAVAGVLGASSDGSHVYFAARGQLVPNKGRTYSQNLAGQGSYNVYLWLEGVGLSYVGPISEADIRGGSGANVGIGRSADVNSTSSRVTPTGKELLFQSSANVTGYVGGAVEAYLYSADDPSTASVDESSIECVSCRRDGQVSLATAGQTVLPTATSHSKPDVLHPPVTLTDDGAQVFFWSLNPLALGAVAGEVNLYEWNDHQISLLSTGLAGIAPQEAAKKQLAFAGASTDGEDVYFATPKALVPQDFDQRTDLYDARAGGGFASSPPPAPCNALAEGSCQGIAAAQQGSPVAPSSSTIAGGGNEKSSTKKHSKKHSKKHGKKRGKTGKKKAQKRRASTNGRAGK